MIRKLVTRILLVCLPATPVFQVVDVSAGETGVYLKSGYFTWKETIDGNDFVKENGMINAFGITRSDDFSGNFRLEELLEIWGGSLNYDGHDISNTTPIKSDTAYLGTREEIAASMPFKVTEELNLGPLAGVGHKFWIRTRSSEDWNLLYGKVGGTGEYSAASTRYFFKAGANIPFYTRNHVNLNSSGFEDVVIYPKSRPGVFAEAGFRISSWSVGLGYEEMNFGKSAMVPTRSTTPTGVAVINSQAYQPTSSSSLISLKIEYRF